MQQMALLTCHPARASDAVRRIGVQVRRADAVALELTYLLEADLSRVRVLPPATPRRADGLWRHTCFEAFIAAGGSPHYCEFNFSPSGAWAAYAFRAYRERTAFEADFDPRIGVSVGAGSLRLDATVPLALLPFAADEPLRVALSAVIEERDGSLTYWALRHPAGQPDFHHPDGFALTVKSRESTGLPNSLKE